MDAGTRILAGLHRDADERAWVSLSGTDGRTVELWVDGAPSRSSRSTPAMTCPPSALQSGEQVIRLAPGQSASATIAGAGGRGGNLRPFGGKIF